MKKILCYGDSNTYGFRAFDGGRYSKDIRWCGCLQNLLGKDFKIIEEGMCDRTGFVDNPKGEDFSAQKHFFKCISNYKNIDLLILALGTNDLQFQYDIDFETVERGLIRLITESKKIAKDIILIPPIILEEDVLNGYFSFQFNEGSVEKSKAIGEIYKKTAKETDCKLFDINDFVRPSSIDGLHYDDNAHNLIAKNLAQFIKKTSLIF